MPRPSYIQGFDPYAAADAALGEKYGQLLRWMEFIPTPRQLEVLREVLDGRWNGDLQAFMLGGAEQGGKTALISTILPCLYFHDLDRLPDLPKQERVYWVSAYEHKHLQHEWAGIKDRFEKLHLFSRWDRKTDTMYLRDDNGAEGTRIQALLTANERNIAGISPLGVVMCEAAQQSNMAYVRQFSRSRHRNGWIAAVGSLEGQHKSWFTSEYMRWQAGQEPGAKAFPMATIDNTTLYPEGVKDPRIEGLRRMMGETMFEERIMGRPQAAPGTVYLTFDPERHLARLPPGSEHLPLSPLYRPELPIHIFEDPGFNSPYVILLAQYYAETLWILDEIYKTGLQAHEMVGVTKARPWWANPDKGGHGDPMYSNRHTAMAVAGSIQEIWEAEGVNYSTTKHRVEEGIERVRDFLLTNPATGLPYLVIDGLRCPGLLSELGVGPNPVTGRYAPYRYKVNEDDEPIGITPLKANDHACDALRNGIVDLFGVVSRPGGGGVRGARAWNPLRDGAQFFEAPEPLYEPMMPL